MPKTPSSGLIFGKTFKNRISKGMVKEFLIVFNCIMHGQCILEKASP